MHCNNTQETRWAVMFTDEEYSKQADAVGLGLARLLRHAGRAKRSLSEVLINAVMSCDGGNEMDILRSEDMSAWYGAKEECPKPRHTMNKSTVGGMRLSLGS